MKQLKAIMTAYSDCNDSKGERNLNFFCEQPLTGAELMEVMPLCVPDGYNNFDPKESIKLLTDVFGANAQYFVAREGSVCIYIKAGPGNLWLRTDEMDALNGSGVDEFCYDGEKQLFRVWWD